MSKKRHAFGPKVGFDPDPINNPPVFAPRTIREEPFLAFMLMELLRGKRISHETWIQCMADPKLALFLITHELQHDFYGVLKNANSEQQAVMNMAMDVIVEQMMENFSLNSGLKQGEFKWEDLK